MPWFKVDDKLHDHPKAWKAGTHAMGLWSLAGSWCSDNLTDGFVPDYVVARWDTAWKRLAKRLVDAGLWVPATRDGVTGWQFHDWNAPGMQPTSEQVKAQRHAAAERQRRARDAAKSRRDNPDTSHRDSQASNTDSHGPPDPTRPDQVRGGRANDRTRPPATCPRHPQGTSQPCGACADARRAHDAWRESVPELPTATEALTLELCPTHTDQGFRADACPLCRRGAA